MFSQGINLYIQPEVYRTSAWGKKMGNYLVISNLRVVVTLFFLRTAEVNALAP
jgi:hypothetical protein